MVSKNVETRKDFVLRHFKDRTDEWENIYDDNQSDNHFMQRMKTVLNQLEKYCPASETRNIADVGCGNGAYLYELSQLPGEGLGIDFVDGMVDLSNAKIKNNKRWKAVQGSATQLEFMSSSFDAIIAAGLVEYFDRPVKVLSEFERVLKPTGVAIVTFPNKYAWGRIGRLPFSMGRYLNISLKMKLMKLLYKFKGEILDLSNLALNEVYSPIRIKKIAHEANLCVEEIISIGFSSWPLFGFKVLSPKLEFSLSSWVNKRKSRFPWYFLGSDLVVVLRKKDFNNG